MVEKFSEALPNSVSIRQMGSGINPSKSKVSQILKKDVAILSVHETYKYTEHTKSKIYISTFMTTYARHKLFIEARVPLGRLVLLMTGAIGL